jgi:hypothetical protein
MEEIDAYDQAIQAYTNAQQQPQSSTEPTETPVATEATEGQSSTEAANEQTPEEGTPAVATWNPQDFSFKADGKLRTAKSKDELLQLASLGFHYNLRAQKLNQREAELYAREQAVPQQQQQNQPEQQDFNPFAPTQSNDPSLAQEVAQLKEQLNQYSQEHNATKVNGYAVEVADFAGVLQSDYGLIKEDVDEFIWSAMQHADKFQEIDDLKAYFFKTHPDAIENRAKLLAKQQTDKQISEYKAKMSRNTVVNGTGVGNTPVSKTKIDDYESALEAAMSDQRFSEKRGIT